VSDLRVPGTVFTTLHFLHNLRISQISLSVTLHLIESLAKNKHSILLGQSVGNMIPDVLIVRQSHNFHAIQ